MGKNIAFEELVDELARLKEELGTWQAVGDQYGVSRAVVWRIVNEGYEPKDNSLRRKLGLEELIIIRARRDEHGRFQKQHA